MEQSTQDINPGAAGEASEREVVGLYSFPKSGNTWLRQIVASTLQIPSNQLQKYVTDMHYGQIMQNPFMLAGRELFYYKSHHKDLVVEHKGQKIKTDKVVYIYRHPLDVFLSYTNFLSKNVTGNAANLFSFTFDSVDDLSKEDLETLFRVFVLFGTLTPQNRVFGGYFEHTANFARLKAEGAAVHIMRYETLMEDFPGEVEKMLRFLGLPTDNMERIYEEADSRTALDGKFFWKRKVGNFRDYLTAAQIDYFEERFGDQLRSLGYPGKGDTSNP